MSIKPMTAATCENLSQVKLPVYASIKYDGIRCLMVYGQAYSRSGKLIPNKYIQKCLAGLHGFDGELVIRNGNFNDATSGIMSVDGQPNFIYMIFDYFTQPFLFEGRRVSLDKAFSNDIIGIPPWIQGYCGLVAHRKIEHYADLVRFAGESFDRGEEGIMLNSPYGKYKHGKSTLKEGYLLKFKPFQDAEAEIVGFEAFETNENLPYRDELGKLKRSSHKENKVPQNKLGAFIVRNDLLWPKQTFKVGTGFTDYQRVLYWNGLLRGKLIKFKYLACGTKTVPRNPVFLGFRSEKDL